MRARILRPLLAGLMVVGMAATAVSAAPPTAGPPTLEDDWGAGVTCEFAVHSEEWAGYRESSHHGALRFTGPAVVRLTNVDHPDQPSVTVHSGSQVRILEPGDGTQRISSFGSTVFFFFPGDVTPSGGDGGGWFLVHGNIQETLSADGFITELSLRGTYRDLCAEIAG